jgi:hypothetical protein
MSFPSFASGEVLTAADMNAVGLWLVKSQAVGTGVSSVTVTGAFSADYENYRIVYSGGSQSITNAISLQLGTTNTNYSGFMAFGDPAAGNTVNGTRDNAGALFTFGGGGGTAGSSMMCEVLNPNLARATEFSSRVRYGSVFGNYVGWQDSTTSFTAFTVAPLSGTLTGGTIRVYGYRN